MNIALRAVHEALGSSEEASMRWRELVRALRARPGAGHGIAREELAWALRSRGIPGSGVTWLGHLRCMGVLDETGEPDIERAESVAVALELVGDSFRPIGAPRDWALVATIPDALRVLLDPPPVRQTGGVMLELIDSAKTELTLAAPYVDDAAVAFLLAALVAAGCRGANVSVVTSQSNGQKFSRVARAWPRVAAGGLRVTEVASNLSLIGSHAKAMVVDQRRGYVGSANLTGAGLARNVELGVELTGSQIADLSSILAALTRLGTTVLAVDAESVVGFVVTNRGGPVRRRSVNRASTPRNRAGRGW